MSKTIYISVGRNLNTLQSMVMGFVETWIRLHNTPVPQKAIVEAMLREGVHDYTTLNALKSLQRKGYLKRSEMLSKAKKYIQLKRVQKGGY